MSFFERIRKWLTETSDPKDRSRRNEEKKAKEMADFLEKNKRAKKKARKGKVVIPARL